VALGHAKFERGRTATASALPLVEDEVSSTDIPWLFHRAATDGVDPNVHRPPSPDNYRLPVRGNTGDRFGGAVSNRDCDRSDLERGRPSRRVGSKARGGSRTCLLARALSLRETSSPTTRMHGGTTGRRRARGRTVPPAGISGVAAPRAKNIAGSHQHSRVVAVPENTGEPPPRHCSVHWKKRRKDQAREIERYARGRPPRVALAESTPAPASNHTPRDGNSPPSLASNESPTRLLCY